MKLEYHPDIKLPWEVWIETAEEPDGSSMLYVFGDVYATAEADLPVLRKRRGMNPPGQLHLEICFRKRCGVEGVVEVMYGEALLEKDQYKEIFIHLDENLVHYEKGIETIFMGGTGERNSYMC